MALGNRSIRKRFGSPGSIIRSIKSKATQTQGKSPLTWTPPRSSRPAGKRGGG